MKSPGRAGRTARPLMVETPKRSAGAMKAELSAAMKRRLRWS